MTSPKGDLRGRAHELVLRDGDVKESENGFKRIKVFHGEFEVGSGDQQEIIGVVNDNQFVFLRQDPTHEVGE